MHFLSFLLKLIGNEFLSITGAEANTSAARDYSVSTEAGAGVEKERARKSLMFHGNLGQDAHVEELENKVSHPKPSSGNPGLQARGIKSHDS